MGLTLIDTAMANRDRLGNDTRRPSRLGKRTESPLERDASDHDGSFEVRLGTAGRFVIPRALRDRLGVDEGDTLRVRVRDGRLIASTPDADVAHAQALLRRQLGKTASLAEELIRERRAERQREENGGED